jgi:charged multivesicular body protein 4
LKRKKLIEKDIQNIQGSMINLQSQVNTLESARVTAETFNAQRQGLQAIKGIHQQMDVDNVEEVMDEIQEGMEMNQEIQDAIGRPVGPLGDLDNDDLMAELDGMMDDEDVDLGLTEEKKVDSPSVVVPNVPDGPVLPTAPTGEVRVKEQTEEEKELAELEAMMN